MQSTIRYTASISNSAEAPGGCCFQLELIKEEERCKPDHGGAAQPALAQQLEAGGLLLEVQPHTTPCTLCASRLPVQVLTLLAGDRTVVWAAEGWDFSSQSTAGVRGTCDLGASGSTMYGAVSLCALTLSAGKAGEAVVARPRQHVQRWEKDRRWIYFLCWNPLSQSTMLVFLLFFVH